MEEYNQEDMKSSATFSSKENSSSVSYIKFWAMVFWKDVAQVWRQQKRGTGVKRVMNKSSLQKV